MKVWREKMSRKDAKFDMLDWLEMVNDSSSLWAVALKILIVFVGLNLIWMGPILLMSAPVFIIRWVFGAL